MRSGQPNLPHVRHDRDADLAVELVSQRPWAQIGDLGQRRDRVRTLGLTVDRLDGTGNETTGAAPFRTVQDTRVLVINRIQQRHQERLL
jgi:hypothetical protein